MLLSSWTHIFFLFHRYYRKPTVVIKHSGLDESGDSNASEDLELPLIVNGHLDINRLPKGMSFLIYFLLNVDANNVNLLFVSIAFQYKFT